MFQASRSARFADLPGASWILQKNPQLAFYREANRALPAYQPGRVVFYGDSITYLWAQQHNDTFFPGRPYIDRGIGGQTSSTMIWRFRQDVVNLHPDTVVILAGSNDIAFSRPFTKIKTAFEVMVQMAQNHHIRIVLCSIPPIRVQNPAQGLSLDQAVLSLNAWLRQFAQEQHLAFIDYYSALADTTGHMAPTDTTDGLHPSAAGYVRMQSAAERVLDALPPTTH